MTEQGSCDMHFSSYIQELESWRQKASNTTSKCNISCTAAVSPSTSDYSSLLPKKQRRINGPLLRKSASCVRKLYGGKVLSVFVYTSRCNCVRSRSTEKPNFVSAKWHFGIHTNVSGEVYYVMCSTSGCSSPERSMIATRGSVLVNGSIVTVVPS